MIPEKISGFRTFRLNAIILSAAEQIRILKNYSSTRIQETYYD